MNTQLIFIISLTAVLFIAAIAIVVDRKLHFHDFEKTDYDTAGMVKIETEECSECGELRRHYYIGKTETEYFVRRYGYTEYIEPEKAE